MGGGSSATKSSPPTIPGWLKPLLGQVTGDYSGFGSMDSLWNEYLNMPQEGTAGIPGGGKQDIGYLQGVANDPTHLTSAEQEAQKNYESFLDQAGKPSEATQAELGLFQSELAPQINQQAELMGQGNSGAALAATDRGMTEAMVPFMQSDLQNQLAASQGMTNLGQLQEGNIQNAMQGQEWRQQTNQKGLDALFNRLMSREKLGTGVLSQPFGLLGSTIGGGTSINTQPKF